jgi:putative transcriptional regulator
MKITQQTLADRVGVSRQSIIAIESGKYVPSTVLGLKLAHELGVGVEKLFVLEEGD